MWPWKRSAEPATRVEPQIFNASPEDPATSLSSPGDWLLDAMGGGPTMAGPSVSEKSAIRSTTVFRCVSLISGLIASLPLSVYERNKDGRSIAINHRVYPLLHDAPSDVMGSFTWRELMTVDLLLGGNHYSLIEYDNAARVIGFLWVPRQGVKPYRLNGRTRYQVSLPASLTGSNAIEIDVDQDEMLHVPGLGFDGVKGLSPIGVAGRQSVGLDIAMAESMSRLHDNGVRPSGVLEVPSKIDKDGFDRLKQQFNDLYSGRHNVGKTIFVDKDSKWTAVSLSPEDAQLIESRRFQVTDICRIYGVPPHLVGETDSSTSWGTGIEQQSLGFLRFTLEPWLKRIEDEMQRKLFAGSRFYAEFDRDALLAMDAKTRSEVFSSSIQNAVMQPAEARRKLNLPFVEGSDRLFINQTMTPLDQAGQQPAAPALTGGKQ